MSPLYKAVQKLPELLFALEFSQVATTLANALVDKYGAKKAEELLLSAAKIAKAQE